MKTFRQFTALIQERMDDELRGSSQITGGAGGTKIGRDRKKSPAEMRRTRAIGGGKTEVIKPYKKRSDQGVQRGSQGPELKAGTAGTKGSAKMSAKELQRKAYLERKAREKGGGSASAPSKKEKAETARKMTQKPKTEVSPKYKPQKASGLTRTERQKLQRTGDRIIRDIRAGKDKPASHYEK